MIVLEVAVSGNCKSCFLERKMERNVHNKMVFYLSSQLDKDIKLCKGNMQEKKTFLNH